MAEAAVCIGDLSPSATRGPMAEVAERSPDHLAQPKSDLKGATSVDAPAKEEGEETPVQGDVGNGHCNEKREEGVLPVAKTPSTGGRSVARICGPSRARCGYCSGKRQHVLGVDDGHNRVFAIDGATRTNGNKEGELAQMDPEPEVDESNTSKSYGLIFDRLPYDTYEEMINRGWRRSGNHLYRPHNFESCCPSISIRLDALRFASRCSPLPSNKQSSRSMESDLAKAVLVRGSKSQRKVGKNILRALERHNAKCTDSRKEAFAPTQGCMTSALSGDDSVHTSNVANMQIDEAGGLAGPDHLEHPHKKTCRRASKVQEGILVAPTKSDDGLQSILDKLSSVVYWTITDEAIKAVSSNFNGDSAPKWAWWSDKGGDVPKWCSFKVAQRRPGSTATIASTSACAAAAGRSRGVLDKGSLAQLLVEALKRCTPGGFNKRLRDVSCHEKSGHVHVTLDAAGLTAAPQPESSLKSNKDAKIPSTNGADEPIAEYITRYQTIAHKLNSLSEAPRHQPRFLTVRSVPSHESSLQPEVHQLFCRYQTAVHGDFDPFFGEGDPPTERDHSHDYAFYRMKEVPGFLDVDVAYSHLDEARRSKIRSAYFTFYRFLCETPLAHEDASSVSNSSASEDGYDVHVPCGTYHQQYRLSTSEYAFDGPLIAVGVVDILPQSLSSVYAFYDPILSASLELGKYTALREIEWVRRASQYRPELHYYYLGYYIHSCPKMTYKSDYKPSELLCPVTLKWVDYEAAKKRLEKDSPIRHCCALSAESPSKAEPGEKPGFTAEDILLDIGGDEPITMRMLNKQGREFIDPHVNEFLADVGLDLCQQFVVKLR